MASAEPSCLETHTSDHLDIEEQHCFFRDSTLLLALLVVLVCCHSLQCTNDVLFLLFCVAFFRVSFLLFEGFRGWFHDERTHWSRIVRIWIKSNQKNGNQLMPLTKRTKFKAFSFSIRTRNQVMSSYTSTNGNETEPTDESAPQGGSEPERRNSSRGKGSALLPGVPSLGSMPLFFAIHL